MRAWLAFPPQGRPVDPANEVLIKNQLGTDASCMVWHPTLPLLTIGWKDGATARCLLVTCRRLTVASCSFRKVKTCLVRVFAPGAA